jgi:hypothetical protein
LESQPKGRGEGRRRPRKKVKCLGKLAERAKKKA